MSLSADFRERFGPWALVTGASSGIGDQFARQLGAAGLNLIVVARRTEQLDQLAQTIHERHGVAVESVGLDLRREDFLDHLLAVCADKDVGLIVSNAGIGAKGPFHEEQIDTLTTILAVNCRASMLLAHAFVPKLMNRGRGGFLITSSIEGFVGFPYSAAYAATKAFTLSFGEGLWGELRERGIDVLVLAPGATDTEILPKSGMNPEDMVGLMAPEEVARLALQRLRRGPVCVTGIFNRLFVGFLSLLPRKLAVMLAGKGMRGALEKSRVPG
jgi:short-subunit dehydrogenase